MLTPVVRQRWLGLALLGGAVGCALVVDYDGYARDSRGDPGDASTGGVAGRAGVGGTGFGGSIGGASGAAGSSVVGGSGGMGGALGGAGGIVSGGGAGGVTVGGGGGVGGCGGSTVCGPPQCSGSAYTTHPCTNGACESDVTLCNPYVCNSTGCLTSCTTSADCVGTAKCNLGICKECTTCSEKYANPGLGTPFCESNSDDLWAGVVLCCSASNCAVTCGQFAVCEGGQSTPPGPACQNCLTQMGCAPALDACTADQPE